MFLLYGATFTGIILNKGLPGRMSADFVFHLRNHIYADFNYRYTDDLGCIEFSGRYPDNLMEEINNYWIAWQASWLVQQNYDIIHAHDWLHVTRPGIHAKQVSGKPLVIHVHATDFDRSRGHINPTVYNIEKDGMNHADCIMCVSELTRQTVINHYHQDPAKCFAVHNAVYPLAPEKQAIIDQRRPLKDRKERVVAFLGTNNNAKRSGVFHRSCRTSATPYKAHTFLHGRKRGHAMHSMIELAAIRGITDCFHFPGFMKGNQVYEMFRASDVYVMPSVWESFGISPLEAMQCGVPTIISKQSGCAEILRNCIKIDYWNINAMADAIYSICTNDSLYNYLKDEGEKRSRPDNLGKSRKPNKRTL